jgi:hypothetical protein
MRRAPLVIVAVGCAVLAGCTGGIPGTVTDDTPTADSDTETPMRSEGCEQLDPRDTPVPPTNLTSESVVPFLESYAAATHWNERFAGEEYVRVDVETNGFVVNRTDTGYVVHVGTRVSLLTCDGVFGDPALYGPGSDYFINGSMLAVNNPTLLRSGR